MIGPIDRHLRRRRCTFCSASRLASLAVLLLGLSACFTTSKKMQTTWLDDIMDGVVDYQPRTRAVAAPKASSPRIEVAVEREPTAAPKPEDLELALLRFTALHRQNWPKGGPVSWPSALVGEWRILLSDLRLGLTSTEVAADRRLLLQMRITLEAELERTVQRFGPAPKDIARDTGRVFAGVRQHLATPPKTVERSDRRTVDVVWPVSPQILTSPFGYRRDPIMRKRHTYRFHAGIDLGGRSGTSIVAAASGKVTSAGWAGGHGKSITLEHPGGIFTTYSHLKRVLVSRGQTVKQGQAIGVMGSTGRSTGPHLHFEVRRHNVPLDPLELLLSSRRAQQQPPAPAPIADRR